jgi:hypothetical protein
MVLFCLTSCVPFLYPMDVVLLPLGSNNELSMTANVHLRQHVLLEPVRPEVSFVSA